MIKMVSWPCNCIPYDQHNSFNIKNVQICLVLMEKKSEKCFSSDQIFKFSYLCDILVYTLAASLWGEAVMISTFRLCKMSSVIEKDYASLLEMCIFSKIVFKVNFSTPSWCKVSKNTNFYQNRTDINHTK